jgi:hypothetical protein
MINTFHISKHYLNYHITRYRLSIWLRKYYLQYSRGNLEQMIGKNIVLLCVPSCYFF